MARDRDLPRSRPRRRGRLLLVGHTANFVTTRPRRRERDTTVQCLTGDVRSSARSANKPLVATREFVICAPPQAGFDHRVGVQTGMSSARPTGETTSTSRLGWPTGKHGSYCRVVNTGPPVVKADLPGAGGGPVCSSLAAPPHAVFMSTAGSGGCARKGIRHCTRRWLGRSPRSRTPGRDRSHAAWHHIDHGTRRGSPWAAGHADDARLGRSRTSGGAFSRLTSWSCIRALDGSPGA